MKTDFSNKYNSKAVRVAKQLSEDIRTGNHSSGTLLPTDTELAKKYNVSANTMRRSIKILSEKGDIVRLPQRGVLVPAASGSNDAEPALTTTDKRTLAEDTGVVGAGTPSTPKKKVIKFVLAMRSYTLQSPIKHPAVAAFMIGAHQYCSPMDYNIQGMYYRENRLVEDIGQAILKQDVDGVIICAGGVQDQDYDFFRTHKIHLADCSIMPKTDDYAVKITLDGTAGLRQSVEHLRNLGHRRIGFAVWDRVGDNGATHRAISELIFEHQMGDPRKLMVKIDCPEDSYDFQDVENFFDITPRPTAVIAHDEFIADVLLAGCERRGIRVPDDLSLVTMNDLMPFGHRVPLTTVFDNQIFSRVITLACEMLTRLVKGKPVLRRQIFLKPRLIVKASSGPAPIST